MKIKFRAWDNDPDWIGWIDPKNIRVSGDNRLFVDTGKEWTEVTDRERVVLEQFTGLQDRNGTDIYAGDIYKALRHFYEVIFVNGAFRGKCIGREGVVKKSIIPLKDISEDGFEIVGGNITEIVGNIHQSPELVGKGVGDE